MFKTINWQTHIIYTFICVVIFQVEMIGQNEKVKEKKAELCFNTMPLFSLLDLNGSSSVYINSLYNEPPEIHVQNHRTFSILYKRTGEFNTLRFSVFATPYKIPFSKSMVGFSDTTEFLYFEYNKRTDFGIAVGLEKRKGIKNFTLYYGLDLFYSYSTQQKDLYVGEYEIDEVLPGLTWNFIYNDRSIFKDSKSTNLMCFGLKGLIGLRVALSNRVFLSSELSLPVYYYWGKELDVLSVIGYKGFYPEVMFFKLSKSAISRFMVNDIKIIDLSISYGF